MLKILAIAALSVASVTAYRKDFLDCAKHAPLVVAVAPAKAAYDAVVLSCDGKASPCATQSKADTQAALFAALEAVEASKKVAYDLDEVEQQAKKVNGENSPLKAGSDICVAGMQACVDADADVSGTIAAGYYGAGFIMSYTEGADGEGTEGWEADDDAFYGQFHPKTSAYFDGWRECAAKTAEMKTACCDSFCPMHNPDMVPLAREAFAAEMVAVKEVLATKAADGTYTFECETGVTFEQLHTKSSQPGALDVFKYINDGSHCVKCGDGTCCTGLPKPIPFDLTTAYAIYIEEEEGNDDVVVETDLINPDCKLQMGCFVSAYETCVRDQFYSCKKDKDGEFNKDQRSCRDKAVLAKCAAMKTTPTSDTSAEIAAAAKCTAANCATQAVECAADMGACAEALKALKAPPAGTSLATCIAGDAFTKCLAGTTAPTTNVTKTMDVYVAGKKITMEITIVLPAGVDIATMSKADRATTVKAFQASAAKALKIDEDKIDKIELHKDGKLIPEPTSRRDRRAGRDITMKIVFKEGAVSEADAEIAATTFNAAVKTPVTVMLSDGTTFVATFQSAVAATGTAGGTNVTEIITQAGAATQFGSVVGLVAAVAAAMFN